MDKAVGLINRWKILPPSTGGGAAHPWLFWFYAHLIQSVWEKGDLPTSSGKWYILLPLRNSSWDQTDFAEKSLGQTAQFQILILLSRWEGSYCAPIISLRDHLGQPTHSIWSLLTIPQEEPGQKHFSGSHQTCPVEWDTDNRHTFQFINPKKRESPVTHHRAAPCAVTELRGNPLLSITRKKICTISIYFNFLLLISFFHSVSIYICLAITCSTIVSLDFFPFHFYFSPSPYLPA
jgi:hypothetical protein